MRKTLQELASYLKEILVPGTDGAYAIQPAFEVVAPPESIRAGVLAFRAFLYKFYDAVAVRGDAYDAPKKVAHAYENRTTLSGYYPFLHTAKTLLLRMGYYGAPAGDAEALVCDNRMFDERLSVPKTLECLRFLADCGICIAGIDLDDKKQNLQEGKPVTITYPENPAMLTGMKAMAIAEADHGTLVNQDVFMRADYRALQPGAPDALAILRDTIAPLPAGVQAFVLQLHARYLAEGLTCVVETKGFWVYIQYCYKRKDVWGVNASLNNGWHINVKPVKTEEYADAIQAFPPALQGIISAGYGCGRKREIGRCDGGCRGLTIPLDASVLALQAHIVTWFDREVQALKRK